MALSEDQIIDLFNEACRERFNGLARFRYFAHAVESEVRKSDEALIRQLVDALIWKTGSEDFGEGGLAREGALKLLFKTIAALREIIARWDADCGSRMAAELPDAIEAARELIAEEMEV